MKMEHYWEFEKEYLKARTENEKADLTRTYFNNPKEDLAILNAEAFRILEEIENHSGLLLDSYRSRFLSLKRIKKAIEKLCN